MSREVNTKRYTLLPLLREAIKTSWTHMDETYLKDVVGAFRHRLEAVVSTKGANEH